MYYRRLTENRIQKSLARKALYDNIYADISGAATEESAEALRKEVRILTYMRSRNHRKDHDMFFNFDDISLMSQFSCLDVD